MSELDCVQVREAAAELALGVLPGEQGAGVLDHLDRCPECRVYVEQLTAAGDQLLDLLPTAEPPAGFETRATAALSDAGSGSRHRRPRRRTWWRRARLTAAAAVIALLAGVAGWAVGDAQRPAPEPTAGSLLRAELVSDGHRVGEVYAYPGSPGWVYMAVDLDGLDGVGCELVHRDGGTERVGWFRLDKGYAHWGVPARVDPDRLTAVRLVARDGTVLAVARFT